MKKLIVLFIITTVLFCRTSYAQTLEETKHTLAGDSAKIAQWMGENMRFVPEEIQYAQSAKYTYKYRKGDCEDWAILSQYFIGDKYETYLIVWIGEYQEDSISYKQNGDKKACHAVLAIEFYSNNWGIIDYNKFISHGSSLANIIKRDCELWGVNIESAYIADLYQYRNQVIKRIKLGE